jgi:hypothetical protein
VRWYRWGSSGIRHWPGPVALTVLRAWILTGHTVIGLALPLLAFAHARSSMKLPGIRGTGTSGLWIATPALLLLALQAVRGMMMQRLTEQRRIAIPRLHLATAVLFVALARTHVFLNE